MKNRSRLFQVRLVISITLAAGIAAMLNGPSVSADTLYVANYGGGIWKFDSSGNQTVFNTASRLSDTYYNQNLAFDATGQLYDSGSSSDGDGAISKIDSAGNATDVETSISGTIRFDKSGQMYVNNGSIYKVSSSGVISGPLYSQSNTGPSVEWGDMAIDSAGNFFIADAGGNGNYIQKIDTHGVTTNYFAPPSGEARPGGLAFDKAGNLYVIYDWTGNIYKIDPSGNATLFGSLPYPYGGLNDSGRPFYTEYYNLAIDSAGDVFASGYVLTESLNTGFIYEFTPSGVGSLFAHGEPGNVEAFAGMAFAPETSSTPEPGALAMLAGCATAGIGALLRRRSRSK